MYQVKEEITTSVDDRSWLPLYPNIRNLSRSGSKLRTETTKATHDWTQSHKRRHSAPLIWMEWLKEFWVVYVFVLRHITFVSCKNRESQGRLTEATHQDRVSEPLQCQLTPTSVHYGTHPDFRGEGWPSGCTTRPITTGNHPPKSMNGVPEERSRRTHRWVALSTEGVSFPRFSLVPLWVSHQNTGSELPVWQ